MSTFVRIWGTTSRHAASKHADSEQVTAVQSACPALLVRAEAVETHGQSTETSWDHAIGASHGRTQSHARGDSLLGCPHGETRGVR